MKNYLLLLFLSVFTFGNAQINSQVVNYQLCDNDADGFATFDLTVKNAEILANINVAEHTVVFYTRLTDSQSMTNPISVPFSFVNTSNPQTIFVRVTNTVTSEAEYTSFSLVVAPKPVANPATLYFCDQNELPVFNLDDAIPQLVGNQQNMSVTFFDSPNGGNVIAGGTIFPTSPVMMLGATISNGSCISQQTSITLTTICGSQTCTVPTGLAVTNITSYSATLSWSMAPPSNTNSWAVLVLPYGSPTPTASSSGFAYVQSSPFTFPNLVPNQCYTFYVKSFCTPNINVASDWSEPSSFCVYDCENNGMCAESLALKAFLDANNNGVKDSGEVAFNNGTFTYEINNSGTTLYGNTNSDTYTIFTNDPANSYDLNFTLNPELAGYYSSTTTYSDISVPTGSGSHTYYFPVIEIQPYNDLEVHIMQYGAPPRPGFGYVNMIRYKNKGVSTVTSGTINFTKDNHVSINTISQNGTTTTANGFSYSFSNLAPNIEREIQVTLQVPTIPTILLGQILTNTVTITPVVDDAFPLNNTASLSQIVVGSYDPNDKTEAHGGKVAMDAFTSNDYLTYTIQFENSGTANTEFIRVEDILNSSLDANSVVMLGASHPYNMRRFDNKLIWSFYDTSLPPTSVDPTASHGYVQFEVKPTAGFNVGTSIPNSADIYFDYNPPIVTSPCQTEFVATLGTSSFASDEFYMYPNPAKTFIHIGLKDASESIVNINVRDVLGKSVKTINDAKSNENTIDVSQFSKGVYFVEITTANHFKITKKLLIQ